jgi:predicted  nucleic acid-binding Zn-ribbon protein
MIREARDGREEAMGFPIAKLDNLIASRDQLAEKVEAADLQRYEKLAERYGHTSAVVPVQGKMCLGCFMELPTAAAKTKVEGSHLRTCENCGRILYWV